MIYRRFLFFLCVLPLFSGCYTFSGITIDPQVSTFSVRIFEMTADNAPANAGLNFAEKFKDKVRTSTRLKLVNTNPDVEFYGKITDYRVVPVAAKAGEVVSENRLEVRISVGYINNKDEKKGWASERSFSHYAQFGTTVDLINIQDQLLDETIYPQLLEDIFNAAFNDW